VIAKGKRRPSGARCSPSSSAGATECEPVSALDAYGEIWLVDFEFSQAPGEHPRPTALVAWEYRTGRQYRLLFSGSGPPYPVGPDTLVVAYNAVAHSVAIAPTPVQGRLVPSLSTRPFRRGPLPPWSCSSLFQRTGHAVALASRVAR
jgi:hypothetical protein